VIDQLSIPSAGSFPSDTRFVHLTSAAGALTRLAGAHASYGDHVMIRNIGIACVLLCSPSRPAGGETNSTASSSASRMGAIASARLIPLRRLCGFASRLTAANGRSGTISWLPAAGKVKLSACGEGKKLHARGIVRAGQAGHRVAQWGPFEIQEELFDRAKKQAALLSAAPFFTRPSTRSRAGWHAINCEHAVCDIGLRPGKAIERTGTAHGHHGSYLVATHLRSWMIELACRTIG